MTGIAMEWGRRVQSTRESTTMNSDLPRRPREIITTERISNTLILFLVVIVVVLQIGMIVAGGWVSSRLVSGVVNNHTSSTVLFTDNLLEPRLQDLRFSSSLPAESLRSLDELLSSKPMARSIVALRIWKDDTVVYAADHSTIGQTLPRSATRARAHTGKVAAEYGLLDHQELVEEYGFRKPLLEIYAPIRETGTDHIIAVAETHQYEPALAGDVRTAKLASWLLFGSIATSTLLVHVAIIRNANRIIRRQRAALSDQGEELTGMQRANSTLRHAREASLRVTAMNEQILRRVGADIHDGPIQLVAVSLLRLDALKEIVAAKENVSVGEARVTIRILRDTLADTMAELRDMAAGLTLPELDKLTVPELLATVARRHERRTNTIVNREIDNVPIEVPPSLKVCLYRFAQEGLNNAFQHAGGNAQTIRESVTNGRLSIEITDGGPTAAFTKVQHLHGGHHDHVRQGLIGLRDRVESLGGQFSFTMSPRGSRLRAEFDLGLINLMPE